MPGPLDGFRIVDLTTMIAGPLAAMVLADQGADVIKVEGPDRIDHVRRAGHGVDQFTAAFLNNNRNKRSLALDLKSDRGRAAFLDVAARADVVIQNFRPGVVDRLGIGYEAVRLRNQRIVYVSMSGFGDSGPYAARPVYDPIIQALSGLSSIQGGADDARPRLVRTIVPDKVTALTAAQAVTAALLARARTGVGQHVRLSMLDSVIAFLWPSDMGSQTLVGREVSTQRAATFIDLIYETADGYLSVSVMTDGQWRALCETVGHAEWLSDPRFATPALRDRHADARLELIQQALRTDTAAHWLDCLERAGVPCAPVLTRSQMVTHPQVVANGIVEEHDHPFAGRVRQARPPARFGSTPTEYRYGAPLLGEHTRAVLREAGIDAAQVESLIRDGIAQQSG